MLVQQNMGDAMLVKKRPVSVDEMNLKSIQRLDPCAVSVVDKSVHAALYQFNKCNAQWVKSAIEGPLFLYKRADKPLYSLMVANRQSLEDHIEPITPCLRFFLEAPYLFINNQESEIRGFWFFEEKDCTRLYNLLVKLVSDLDPSTSAIVSFSNRQMSNKSLNGCNAQSDAAVGGADSQCKELDEMPVVLQQLLSKQITTKLPDVPTEGALSADQIEKQFLEGASAGMSTESRSSVKMITNCASTYQENEGNDAVLASMNNLSISATNASSDLKNVEKHHAKNENEHDDISGDNSQVVCLTKDQLLVALKYLLKEDGFVTRLHSAYLESINTRLGLRE